MLRELRHPRLPAYVDAFREGEGVGARLYLAYRYLEGVSFREEMEERRYTEEEVLDLVEEVLEILRHLHCLQPPLIHGDLKPANMVRRRDGTVALIDFGVARELEKTLHGGTPAGTVGYMPPEQLPGQVDITSDIYALGATALHMLVRRPPWEFMDGPELRLPPLENAPAARIFLRRVLAPRRAQRFASAREALWALKRVRAGGTRLSRTAVAAAGVAAATLAAVFVGADRRSSSAETQKRLAPEMVQVSVAGPPAPRPQPTARRLPPSPGAQQLATWRGGALTRADVEESLRRLPPWLKSDQPWWIQQHVIAQVRRKLLVAEAERRGLAAPPSAVGPERERILGRALLEVEASKESRLRPARAVRKVWERVTGALYAAADVRLDEPEIFRIEPQKMVGPPPAPTPETAAPGRLEIAAKTGLCIVEVVPSQRRYGGRCEALDMLSQALLDADTLQLVDLAPGSVLPAGFYARYTDDFVENRQLGADGLETADTAERSLAHADIRLAEATGTVSPSGALDLLEVARPALRRCLALALQEAPQRPLHLKARIRVELRPGTAAIARMESEPPLGPRACASALARPELGGTGQLTFFADLERRGSVASGGAPR
jgi:serine/threonine protein kinase